MIKKQKDQPVKILYYDLETVTLGHPKNCCAFYQFSGIIEINGVEVDRFDYLVNPNGEFEYDDECLIFNGITRDDLATYKAHEEVYEEFIALLDKHVNKFDKTDKLFKCGFNNMAFDDPKLWEWFAGMDIKKGNKYCTIGSYMWANAIDIYPIISLVFIKYRNLFPNFKLETVAKKLAEMGLLDKKYSEDVNYHDALVDIEATRDIFHFALKMFKFDLFNLS